MILRQSVAAMSDFESLIEAKNIARNNYESDPEMGVTIGEILELEKMKSRVIRGVTTSSKKHS